jgi:hypothetical protein
MRLKYSMYRITLNNGGGFLRERVYQSTHCGVLFKPLLL